MGAEKEYCVKIKTNSGCSDGACCDVKFEDKDECEVEIIKRKVNDSTYTLFAQVKTRDSVYFEWNTGETTQSITVDSEKEYCVKIKTSTGCTDEACCDVEFDDEDECDVEIIKRKVNDSTCIFYAQVKTRDSVKYEWSTGETTQSIEVVNADGEYCVKIITASGCTDGDCIKVDVRDDKCKTKIAVSRGLQGQISLSANTKRFSTLYI